jgi:hypothetical protein
MIYIFSDANSFTEWRKITESQESLLITWNIHDGVYKDESVDLHLVSIKTQLVVTLTTLITVYRQVELIC